MNFLKLSGFLLALAIQTYASAAGVSVSKTNAYVVYGPATGVSVSKTNAYVVYGPPAGVSVSKVNVYVVVHRPQPSVQIITKSKPHQSKPSPI